MTGNYSRDETEFGAFGDSFGVDARTVNFDTGSANLQPIAGKAPALSAAQIASAAVGRAAFNAAAVSNAAAATSVRNQPYVAARAASDKQAIATSNVYASSPANLAGGGAWNFAGQDYGLLPAAAKIVVPLIATAATGGLAAPAVGAAIKSIASTKDKLATAAASGDIKGSVSLVKQADQLISKAGAGVQAAKDTINTTIAAATAGVPAAKNGLNVLVAVDADRVAKGVPVGVAQTPGAAASVVLPRLAFSPSTMPAVPTYALQPRAPVTAPVTALAIDGGAALAALQQYTVAAQPTDPKYLVLDTGKIFANELARQALPGWLVQFNGQVVRQ